MKAARPAIVRVLWSRVVVRHWGREPLLTATLAGILALGVGGFLAVRLANRAAVSGFAFFTDSITGGSDLILRPRAGGLDPALLRELRRVTGPLPVDFYPVLERGGVMEGEEERGLLRLVGLDLVAAGNVLGGDSDAAADDAGDILGAGDAALVGESFAAARGLGEGDRIRLWIDDAAAELRIAGVLPDPANRPAIPENLVLLDLPVLQAIAGEVGTLSRIEIRFPAGTDGARIRGEATGLIAAFGAERGLLLETPEDRKESVTRMSAAFRMNLTILSGLALLVGVYLIMQAMEAAVTKRRAEIAILRSLGVTPGEVRRAWLAESLVLGLAGGLLGVAVGRLLASGLVGGIAATVNTLYYETTTRAASLHPGEAAFSLAFGLAASLVAGWIPAREAALTPPAQAMRQGARGGGTGLGWPWFWGGGLLAAAFALTRFPPLVLPGGTAIPLGGYLAALAAVVGTSLLLGGLFRPLSGWLRAGGNGAMRNYAASRLAAAGGRHRLCAAGLSAAIGMSAAMAILVASFEETLTSWISQILRADVYVFAPGAPSAGNGNSISEAEWKRILSLPGVDGADTLRRRDVTYGGREIVVGCVSYHDDPARHLELLWIDPPDRPGPDGLKPHGEEAPPAWISEPFARRFGKNRGETLDLPTPAGIRRVRIAGVYADYGSEAGTVLLAREVGSGWFGDDSVSNLALYLAPGTDPERFLERFRSGFPRLVARTNARLREESIRVFHRTFAVTHALEAIAVAVAVGGLGLALAGLLLERRNELAILRSLGATRREIARAAMWEGSGIALAGLAGGIGSSFFLGWILIGVINPQCFGWTLRYEVPWGALALLSGLTLAAAAGVARTVGHRCANLESDLEE